MFFRSKLIKPFKIGIPVVILVVAIGVGYWFFYSQQKQKPSPDVVEGKHEDHGDHDDHESKASERSEILIKPAEIETYVEVQGRMDFHPKHALRIHPKFPGVVQRVFKEAGDFVRVGDPLVAIENNVGAQTYTITSPIGGSILGRNVGVGQTVNQEDEVFSVGDISILQARFFISNRDIRDVVAGRDVIILAERESPVRTKIDFVSPVLDQETRTATAFAEIQNSNIRPGIFITGAVVQGRKTAKLSLPIAYCGAEGSKQIGILIRDGEKTSLRKVEIGARDYFNCEVLSGIDVGEVVVDVEVGSAKS